MNTDQLARIRSALRQAIAGAPDTCVTMEIEGQADKWIQVVEHTINAAYPPEDNPEERIKQTGAPEAGAKLINWEGGKFATFQLEEIEINTLAAWIDAYFVRVLDCPPGEYHFDIRSEQL